jgi:DNA mismatch repair protein MutL
MPIHKLPQHLINRLKAGEIVERPAALVKELLENSIDAGATHIRIEVTDAGMTRLLISDDGTGITRSDLPLTIERYATSKITEEADLEHIMSYGFRGEALASIAEVSTMRLQTRSTEETLPAGVGRELTKVDEHVQIKELPFASAHGTTIIIEHLFANIPARKKFLKSPATEWTHLHHVLLNYFLAHPQIAWTVIKDTKTIYQLPSVETLLERVQSVFDKEWSAHLREIILGDEQIHIYGLISDTTLHFPAGDHIYLFVNHRPVLDKLLRKALLDIYQRQMPGNRFPFAVIFLDCLPTLVDCNVHPKKQEVRFLDP